MQGLETSLSILLRSAIHRSYTAHAKICEQTVINPLQRTLRISKFGFSNGIAFIVIHLAINFCSICFCIPFLLHNSPQFPGIRLASDRTFFVMMLTKMPIGQSLKALSTNSDTEANWAKIDRVVRLGESITSIEDTEKGELMLATPRLVTALSPLKRYV